MKPTAQWPLHHVFPTTAPVDMSQVCVSNQLDLTIVTNSLLETRTISELFWMAL